MQNQKNIVVITASEIKNLELAQQFKQSLESLGANVKVINLIELELPLFHSRSSTQFQGEILLGHVLTDILEAHGFVFISPEYNGGTPPVFNNFLAWLSRSAKDWRTFLNGKAAALGTFSGGGGANVLQIMRSQLSFIGMNVVGRQVTGSPAKAVDEKSIQAVCTELVKIAN